ncbi:hypothetical protein CBR_g29952 [Chara braunii]|uniref:Uncharacterized protein n=1 Tax=Chara braunii TaxID=69332 RepID=A0A388LBL9_CHABU|nr:hypothetical protein CBR_g29952 [Chara braunii]|eukprot:GBG79686.1 hypothetical protein CBR_g29952 [Chara braunii]
MLSGWCGRSQPEEECDKESFSESATWNVEANSRNEFMLGLPCVTMDSSAGQAEQQELMAPNTNIASTCDECSTLRWQLIKCKNGLRFFELMNEVEDQDRIPVQRSIGAVEGSSHAIFELVMNLGSIRRE